MPVKEIWTKIAPSSDLSLLHLLTSPPASLHYPYEVRPEIAARVGITPFPSLDDSYSYILEEESRCNVMLHQTPIERHTRETCWQIHGRPVRGLGGRQPDPPRGQANLAKTIETSEETNSGTTLSSDEIQLFCQLLTKLDSSTVAHPKLWTQDLQTRRGTGSENVLLLLLNSPLFLIQDMKRQCDEKREVYEYMIAQQKEKGRSKSGKGESITSQQLQAAQDEYEEEATLCAFRIKSLKQGQSRSLLTQAARHHAAQLNFFQKGLQSLDTADQHVRMIAEQHHIDYQFSGLEDDSENDYEANEVGELSFDYRSNDQRPDVSVSLNSTEVSSDKNQGDLKVSSKEHRFSSHSAPIFAEKFDPAEKARQLFMPSAAKSNAYVLPTPVNVKETNVAKTSGSGARTSASGRSQNLWHSSPLDEKIEKDCGDGKSSDRTIRRLPSLLKESNSDTNSTQLPRPVAEGPSLPQVDALNAFDTKKVKRQAFSGPLTNKPVSVKPVLSGSSTGFTELPPLGSAALSRFPMPQPLSPKASSSALPSFVSSSRMSELHELPRPPGNQSTKSLKSSEVAHSAPLIFRNQEGSATNKIPLVASTAASPLPIPPLIVSRSFSIPPSSQRGMSLHVGKILDTSQVPQRAEEAASPPLTPISLSDINRVPSRSDLASHSNEIQGGS
ncbi:uncharacterized protein G2W53_040901 [Senna tora]|uniref:Hydroxyproline-rich glycoprotein family protein n=1 Tax=Senna tora TaxID=362788 RepID=A0A834SCY6_9FABA|nr:uncharacterized protein G2W53_040901 [Senna tora]